jgi:hypothetical protein
LRELGALRASFRRFSPTSNSARRSRTPTGRHGGEALRLGAGLLRSGLDTASGFDGRDNSQDWLARASERRTSCRSASVQ